jgi:tetratricopeptide (TPR) repeat protein
MKALSMGLWMLVDPRACINHRARHAVTTVAALLLLLGSACSPPEERELSKGFSYEKSKDFKNAVTSFDRTLVRAPQSGAALVAAREGAKVALLELKDFKKAAEFNRFIVLRAPQVDDRIAAQKQLAAIYFDQLADYPRAIEELNKLLYTVTTPDEKDKIRIRLAKAYFYTNNFFQAESEAIHFLQTEHDEDSSFQMMVLKGNIYVAKKDMQKAIETFRYILDKYPEKAVKENAAMTLAVAYEEMKDYKNAIDVLEKMKPYHSMPEYIDLRIKKLLIDQKNQPGAKGTRRK